MDSGKNIGLYIGLFSFKYRDNIGDRKKIMGIIKGFFLNIYKSEVDN